MEPASNYSFKYIPHVACYVGVTLCVRWCFGPPCSFAGLCKMIKWSLTVDSTSCNEVFSRNMGTETASVRFVLVKSLQSRAALSFGNYYFRGIVWQCPFVGYSFITRIHRIKKSIIRCQTRLKCCDIGCLVHASTYTCCLFVDAYPVWRVLAFLAVLCSIHKVQIKASVSEPGVIQLWRNFWTRINRVCVELSIPHVACYVEKPVDINQYLS